MWIFAISNGMWALICSEPSENTMVKLFLLTFSNQHPVNSVSFTYRIRSLRLITQKILIFLTSAIRKCDLWRAKQMSETREFWDVGIHVCVHVAANPVPTLLAALGCQPKRKKGTKCSVVGQVTWGCVFLRSFRV